MPISSQHDDLRLPEDCKACWKRQPRCQTLRNNANHHPDRQNTLSTKRAGDRNTRCKLQPRLPRHRKTPKFKFKWTPDCHTIANACIDDAKVAKTLQNARKTCIPQSQTAKCVGTRTPDHQNTAEREKPAPQIARTPRRASSNKAQLARRHNCSSDCQNNANRVGACTPN